jgi:lysophospholipase L1-like esterase
VTLRYVALGDSYTIGTAVAEDERWPNQLVRRLAGHPPALELVANLAVNGYTSRDVIRRQLPRLATLGPGFVSLLVGVNDVVQGVDPEVYRTNVAAILDAMATSVPTGRIVVVTTPDYTVTPRGSDYGDPARQSAAIRVFNGIMTEASVKHEVAVVDVLDLSLDANADRSLVAEDGLHPSGVQYARWIDRIAPTVRLLLAGEPTC